MLRNVRDGTPCVNTIFATVAAAAADGPKSNVGVRRSDTAIPGVPSSAPSRAPATVPEYVMSSPRFQPLLMPETTRSGNRFRMISQPRFTQSVGVPSTA